MPHELRRARPLIAVLPLSVTALLLSAACASRPEPQPPARSLPAPPAPAAPAAGQPAAAAKATAPTASRDRPNIVFLISDDHGAADLGCYGNAAVRTPHLDALARRGLRYERAYATSPQCSPSRTSIITGRTPHATGTSRLHAPLRRQQPTVIEALKRTGYYLGAYRKLHLGEEMEKRFDFHGGTKEPFSTFFERRPADRPFFLHVGFDDPHRPYAPGAFTPPHDPAKVIVPSFLPDAPEVRRDLAHYYDEIARMDAEVGEILALLEKHGLAGNTLVFFAGDHGMPFPGAKGSLYEPGVRVPLLFVWPEKLAPGSVSQDLVSLLDLAPTWLELAGLPPLARIEGRSLVPRALALAGRPTGDATRPPAAEAVFMERNWHDNLDLVRAVRTRRHKLIRNYLAHRPYQPTEDLANSPTWKSLLALHRRGRLAAHHRQRFFLPRRPEVELYDLQVDPEEKKNLAADPRHATVLRELDERLSRWMRVTNDFLPPPLGEYPAAH
jgi:arylsulfatase A-like enzyme